MARRRPGRRQVASFLAALFKGKSAASDEDDEGAAAAPAKIEKPVKTTVVAAAARQTGREARQARRLDPAARLRRRQDRPRAEGGRRCLRRRRDEAAKRCRRPQTTSAPQTPADIINARGFWDNVPAPQQATPAQVAALNARKAVAAADPQPTASVSESFNKAMAYAPAAVSPVDRSNVVAASAPHPAQRPPGDAVQELDGRSTTSPPWSPRAAKVQAASSPPQPASPPPRATTMLWLRVIMLAPSASTSMSVTVFGDADLTLMRAALRQAAGDRRHDLLRRSDARPRHRPLHRLVHRAARDEVVRPAHRRAAVRRNSSRKIQLSSRRKPGPIVTGARD